MPGRSLVVLVISLITAPAGADTLSATQGQPLREVSHAVDVRLRDGVATYTVRRSFANPGVRHEEANLLLTLPAGAAATGLRINAGRRWYRGELMKAERAAALYRKLTGIGPHEPRDPAILIWLGKDEARLRIFPVPPGRTATVEYTLTAPTSYAGGRHGLEYTAPGSDKRLALPVVRVFPQAPRAVVTLDGKLVAAAQPVTIARKKASAGDTCVPLQVTPPPMRIMAARMGRVVAGKGKQFSRLEVDVAPRLGVVPKKPRVVFVLDASHSVGPRGLTAQLALMRAFWSHVPDARVEVVLFRRKATRLYGAFVSLAEAERRLEAAGAAGRLAPGNGSNLDRALTLAVTALGGAKIKRGGRGYLVMLGDGRVRLSFRNRPSLRALARVPRGVVTHVAITSPGRGPMEHRDDGHDLSPLAAARGGVLLQVTGVSAAAHDAKQLRRVALGLVRPVRIDHFKVSGFSGDGFSEVPEQLQEGTGLRKMNLLAAAPRRLVLSGKIWARPIKRRLRASAAFSRTTAALVFSSGQHTSLSPAEMLRVARHGRAVSPVTSYLAIEPGVRPSTEGLGLMGDEVGETYGLGGLGLVGTGRGGGGVHNDMGQEVGAVVRRCLKRHRPPRGWSATLSVETTLHEIVDVSLKSPQRALDRCIVEGTWTVRLPRSYHQAHQVHKVSLPI